MTALSAIVAQAAAEFPSFPLSFDDGVEVQLKSVMDLSDDELKQFSDSRKALESSNGTEDVAAMKSTFVDILAGVSSDRAKTASELTKVSLGVLTVLFKQYVASNEGAEKSTS